MGLGIDIPIIHNEVTIDTVRVGFDDRAMLELPSDFTLDLKPVAVFVHLLSNDVVRIADDLTFQAEFFQTLHAGKRFTEVHRPIAARTPYYIDRIVLGNGILTITNIEGDAKGGRVRACLDCLHGFYPMG